MTSRLFLALLAWAGAVPGTAHAGAGGTLAPGGTTSIVIGLVAIALIVLIVVRARRK